MLYEWSCDEFAAEWALGYAQTEAHNSTTASELEVTRQARGVAYSETVRRALEAYYERPAPAPDTTAELRALQAQVAALADQVAQLLRLTVELDALRADNARLQLALVGSVYGDKPARNRAALLAAAALEDLKASAGGGDNGRDDSSR